MSYKRETAEKPLTLEPFDEVILIEREQKHWINEDEPCFHAMPFDEYCELRDKYIEAVHRIEHLQKILRLVAD